jgi:parallel beta-helix repeat protein
MLDRQSNRNSVYQNTLVGNRDGVAVWDSHSNAIYGNEILGNTRGIRLNRLSSQNVVRDNLISGTTQYGVYVYDEATQNQIVQNQMEDNKVGVYLRAPANGVFGNNIANSEQGIYLTLEATANQIAENRLSSNETGIYLKTYADDYVWSNVFATNGNNLQISSAWRIVP